MELVKNETHGNTLQVFNCELGQVRVIVENGEPLFCLSDLAHSLDFRDGNNLKAQILAEYDNDPLYIFNMDRVVGTKKDGTPAIQNAPCISDKVNMDYLKKNIDHLAECLAIATTELD